MSKVGQAPTGWRPDFLKLWAGQSVSLLGSQISLVALPLTAVLVLEADAAELGLINTALWLPFLLFALIVGVWADRVRRLPLLIGADLGRTLVMGVIAVLALSDTLGMPVLMALVFGFGTLTVVFEVSYYSFIPGMVPSSYLVAANSRLQASASVAEMGGPSAGGVLVQLLSAPAALVADAVSYLVSAASLATISTKETRPDPPDAVATGRSAIQDGLRFTYRNRYLRACAACSTFYNLFDQWLTVLFLVYAVDVLDLGAASIGLIFSTGAVGALIGSLVNRSLTRRVGVGPVFVCAFILECAVLLTLPAVSSAGGYVPVVLAAVFLVNGLGVAATSIVAVSVRQAATPESMLGRVNATYRFLSYGAIAVGAFLGGQVGEHIGLRVGLLVGALALIGTAIGIALSPLRHLRSLDEITVREPAPTPTSAATGHRCCPRSAPRPD